MAGTSEGGKKGARTLAKLRGKNYLVQRARKAGSKGKADGVRKGYAVRPDLASENGKKGAAARWGNR